MDLFAAGTASLLAWTDLLAGDLHRSAGSRSCGAGCATPSGSASCAPTASAITGDGSACTGRASDNWTPWIHSNLLTASLLLDERREDAVVTAWRATGALDRYLDSLPADGGCDEGIAYWWRAGASLFECVQTLADACGDAFGAFGLPKLRAAARYPLVSHICGGLACQLRRWLAKAHRRSVAALPLRQGDRRRPGGQARDRTAGCGPGWPGQADPRVHHAQQLPSAASSPRCLTRSGRRSRRGPSRCPRSPGSRRPACSPPGSGRATRRGCSWPPRLVITTSPTTTTTSARSSSPATAGRSSSMWVSAPTRNRPSARGATTCGPCRAPGTTCRNPAASRRPPAASHAARAVTAELTAEASALTMDLAPAYPAGAGLRFWRRTLRLDRGRGIVVDRGLLGFLARARGGHAAPGHRRRAVAPLARPSTDPCPR